MSTAIPETDRPPSATAETEAARPSRAEASRANGSRSRGPTSAEGKARSKINGCKHGLTGDGSVLPPEAVPEVDRLEADFARQIRPKSPIEVPLVRQLALATWRTQTLALLIAQHDADTARARYATFLEDQQVEAEAVGRTLSDDPPTALARLRRTTAGVTWLMDRWELLGNALFDAEDEGGVGCTWTDEDLALILDLLGRPTGLRHLDRWVGRLRSLREQAQAGSAEAVAELKAIIAEQQEELSEHHDWLWERVEVPQLKRWEQGLEIDLGPEGQKLRRYEAAADRLFRSAWQKLEMLRKERGEPLFYPTPAAPAPAPTPPPRPPATAPAPRSEALAPPSQPASSASPSHPAPASPRPRPLDLPTEAFVDLAVTRGPRPR